jgi:hypothetical protein
MYQIDYPVSIIDLVLLHKSAAFEGKDDNS